MSLALLALSTALRRGKGSEVAVSARLTLVDLAGLQALKGCATAVASNSTTMAGVLGLAAGVMLTVSLFDMWLPAVRAYGLATPTLGFAVGWVIFVVLDFCVPDSLAHGEMGEVGDGEEEKGPEGSNQAWRLAVLMAVTLTIHNVPEGIAVVVSSYESWR